MKLETKIRELTTHLPETGTFHVIAFEMTHDGEGWSVNTPFRIASNVTPDEIPAIIRDRWEVIAANYGRQLVSSLENIACTDEEIQLEADCFPIADIRPA
jgi:hypothetical protein